MAASELTAGPEVIELARRLGVPMGVGLDGSCCEWVKDHAPYHGLNCSLARAELRVVALEESLRRLSDESRAFGHDDCKSEMCATLRACDMADALLEGSADTQNSKHSDPA